MVTCQERIVFAPGAGLEVTEAIPATDGTIQKRTFMHKVFLLSISADSPARQKMAMWPAVAAYIACGWCLFEGCKIDGEAAATRFKGYAEPAEQVLLGGSPCKVGAARLQVSDFLHHQRARSVEDGSSAAQKSGCNGYSVFPEMLSYVSYSDVWELPIYHAGEVYLALLLTTSTVMAPTKQACYCTILYRCTVAHKHRIACWHVAQSVVHELVHQSYK